MRAAPGRGVVHRGSESRLPDVMGLITVGVPEAMAEVQVQRGIAQMVGTEALRPMAVALARGTTGAQLTMMTTVVLQEAVGLLLEVSNEYCFY